MGGVVAVGLVFEEGKVSGMEESDDDVDGRVLEVVVVVVVVVCGLPSPSLPLVSFSVVLLDCIGTTEGFARVLLCFVLPRGISGVCGGHVPFKVRTIFDDSEQKL